MPISSIVNPIRLAIFDWAGTTVDHGCIGPVEAFVRLFANNGIDVTVAQAREPMGLAKREHIQMMLRMPAIAAGWRAAKRRDATEKDLDALYEQFVPLQLEALADHSELVPGLHECVAALRQQGMKIGATTGYFREAADRVRDAARRQGYDPDFSVCADDVPAGRPEPWMIFRNMESLRVYPPSAVVKVGDTVHDIAEGQSAGTWTIAVCQACSDIGLGAREFSALSPSDQRQKLADARKKFEAAGAHVVIDTLAETPSALQAIASRAVRGEKP